MLDFEIRGLQEEIADFILNEIVYKHGKVSIVRKNDFKRIYGRERYERLL